MKLRISVPPKVGSQSSHSKLPTITNCARRSHGSMYPLMPDAYTSQISATPVNHENQRKPR